MATITGEVRFTWPPLAVLPEWSGDVLVSLEPGERPPFVIRRWDRPSPGLPRLLDALVVFIDWRHDAPQALRVEGVPGYQMTTGPRVNLPPSLVRFRVARPEPT